MKRYIDADEIQYTMLYKENWITNTGVEKQGVWKDDIDKIPTADVVEVVRCKDCRHFEYDHPYIIQGIPVLGHEVCNAWGDGCKTDENGYCFMAERRTDDLQ